MRILTVGLNPTLQRTLVVERLLINTVHRADRSRLDVAGKAANVARVLTQVGYSAVHLCHAGGATGDQWRALCRADRIEVVSPRSHAEARTCTTVIDHNTRSSTEFVEPAPAVTEETASSVMREFQGRIAAFDALLI
jgi:fructose-1-phosphate kinase PfkB-like protein